MADMMIWSEFIEERGILYGGVSPSACFGCSLILVIYDVAHCLQRVVEICRCKIDSFLQYLNYHEDVDLHSILFKSCSTDIGIE